MNYYIDTEFLEGSQKKRFLGFKYGETKPTIDLISIGIVAEDDRQYYAICNEFNLKEAWNRYDWKQRTKEEIHNTPALGTIYKEYWIRENVLKPIFLELCEKEDVWAHGEPEYFTYKIFKRLILKYGKSKKQIAEEIKAFCIQSKFIPNIHGKYGMGTDDGAKDISGDFVWDNPIFYAYYADYDWVVFCWIFGKMMDLPKGFPMYCIDLKQTADEFYEEKKKEYYAKKENKGKNFLSKLSMHPEYPTQLNEHNALFDAKWNKRLHHFLQTVK